MKCREELIDFSCYDVHKDGTVFSKTINKETKIHLMPNGYVMNGYLHKDGTNHKHYRHRVIWYYFKGNIPEGYEIDHINGDKTDNSLENLRCVTHKENYKNPTTIEKMKITNWENKEVRSRINAAIRGIPKSEEQKKKQSFAMSGEKNPNWGKKNPVHSARMKKAPRDEFGRWIKKED